MRSVARERDSLISQITVDREGFVGKCTRSLVGRYVLFKGQKLKPENYVLSFRELSCDQKLRHILSDNRAS